MRFLLIKCCFKGCKKKMLKANLGCRNMNRDFCSRLAIFFWLFSSKSRCVHTAVILLFFFFQNFFASALNLYYKKTTGYFCEKKFSFQGRFNMSLFFKFNNNYTFLFSIFFFHQNEALLS